MSKTLVVVTPARNEEKFIGAAAKSVINQMYPITKYVVVDDRSTDRTKEIIEEVGKEMVMVLPSKRKSFGGYRVYGAPQMTVAQVGINYLDHHVPDWDFLLRHDADIVIPPDYCEQIIMAMKLMPSIVMAGAAWIETPTDFETTFSMGVRNGSHIIQGKFYRYCKARGYTYNNLYGEILLERLAWANGLYAMPLPLSVKGLRETTPKHDPPVQKGMEYFLTGRPFLSLLIMLRRNLFSSYHLKMVIGWLRGLWNCPYPEFLDKQEREVLRKCFFQQHIASLRRRLTSSSKFFTS